MKNKRNDEETLNNVIKWITIVGCLGFLLSFFIASERSRENTIYNEGGTQYFYRGGARFIRAKDGWIIIPEGRGVTPGFISDPNFEMPGDAKQEVKKKED